jgi:hypothetical protein
MKRALKMRLYSQSTGASAAPGKKAYSSTFKAGRKTLRDTSQHHGPRELWG